MKSTSSSRPALRTGLMVFTLSLLTAGSFLTFNHLAMAQ
ncbi:MAG: hypothetical protein JWL81_597, partial [Verrucomicrobiales bacterium]|nr:hypothetical protein [Verrucomicrobiales bacterium]